MDGQEGISKKVGTIQEKFYGIEVTGKGYIKLTQEVKQS